MVASSDALTTLRHSIINTGSAYLRNVMWVPGVTCTECGGVPGEGYMTCLSCTQRSHQPGLADRLGFVTYAWPGHQTGRVMYGYKAAAPAPANYSIVAQLTTYAVAAHWPCMSGPDGSYPDAWATVPSLRGREGDHPLSNIASVVLRSYPRVPIVAAPKIVNPRALLASNFVVEPTAAGHVLLIEDTWTTGGHVQSAAAALKAAGVDRVTVLTVARWLEPTWAKTKDVITALKSDFNPDVCPFTGQPC
jgi:hypothetical protein